MPQGHRVERRRFVVLHKGFVLDFCFSWQLSGAFRVKSISYSGYLWMQVAGISRPFLNSPQFAFCLTMPGVDYSAAMTLLSEIGDIKRFPTPDKLASWVGIAPVVWTLLE